MEKFMEKAISVIKLSACVCAQDGVISNRELDKCFELVSEHFQGVTQEMFDEAIDLFFDENLALEDYLENINLYDLDKYAVLKICYESAISDGFEIRENLAFVKSCNFFEILEEEFLDA